MKMARASERDLDMAMKLCTALESLERGFMPLDARDEENDDSEDFDSEDSEQCYRALNMVLRIVREGSIGRVVWGMTVVCDPRNELLDSDANCIELHPRLVAALAGAEELRLRQKGLV